MNPIEMFHQIGLFALTTLLIGVLPLVASAIYAARPTEGRLALMRPLSLVALFGGSAGTLGGLVNALSQVARDPAAIERRGAMFAGLSEALVPLVFGLICLTVAWLLVTVGMWRGVREG